jgi:hypothetical protein
VIEGTSVAEVLTFARSGKTRSYDLVGFRAWSASSFAGPLPLQTLAGERAAASHRRTEKAERLSEFRRKVKALSFNPKALDGRVSYEIIAQEIRLQSHGDGEQVERWMS